MSLSLISQAKMVGFSLLYCSILDTTAGVATFGLLPPISPGGRRVPRNKHKFFKTSLKNVGDSFNLYRGGLIILGKQLRQKRREKN